jgi:hypothetical protein
MPRRTCRWRLFWRVKSRPRRPQISLQLRQLIQRMATAAADLCASL